MNRLVSLLGVLLFAGAINATTIDFDISGIPAFLAHFGWTFDTDWADAEAGQCKWIGSDNYYHSQLNDEAVLFDSNSEHVGKTLEFAITGIDENNCGLAIYFAGTAYDLNGSQSLVEIPITAENQQLGIKACAKRNGRCFLEFPDDLNVME